MENSLNKKKFAFMAGMPRSGSTLLSAILNQNPQIYSSTNSEVCSVLGEIEKQVVTSEQYRAYPKPNALKNASFAFLQGFYSDIESQNIIDKCRDWTIPENFYRISSLLPYKPKVIITLRDVLDVLASFINLVENSGKNNLFDKQITTADFNFYRPINDIRCDYLMRPKGMIDNVLYGIGNAVNNSDSFYFVEYENLVSDTPRVIQGIYDFLQIPYFDHDYENIVHKIQEDDSIYGLEGMHEVRSSIGKRDIDPSKILSEYVIDKYSGLEFWKDVR